LWCATEAVHRRRRPHQILLDATAPPGATTSARLTSYRHLYGARVRRSRRIRSVGVTVGLAGHRARASRPGILVAGQSLAHGRNRPGDLHVRDTIELTYRIVNTGKAPVYVPRGFEATACLGMDRMVYILPWIEDPQGRSWGGTAYGASCGSTPGSRLSSTERLNRGAVLLPPGEAVIGTLPAALRPSSPPGNYLVGASLHGWTTDDFDAPALEQIKQEGASLLTGEVKASVTITFNQ
jgi:hypothetical protein